MPYYICYRGCLLGEPLRSQQDAENKLVQLQRVFKNISIVEREPEDALTKPEEKPKKRC